MDNTHHRPGTVTIKANRGWQLVNLREIWDYRDLLRFLVLRDIKVLYAQTILGFLWAILNPLFQVVVFSVIFGKVAKIDTSGIPYVLFSTIAIVPWTYMSSSMSMASQSLVAGQNMLGKVYFPRMIFPLTAPLAKMVDFTISLVLIFAVMIYFQVQLTTNILYLPLFMLLMLLVPMSVGLWMSSLAIRFRDVKFAMQFMMNLLIYSAPILYSADKIPPDYRFLYSLNPIVAVIEGFRGALLGGEMQWMFIWPGAVVAVSLFIAGAFYFRKMESIIVDVI